MGQVSGRMHTLRILFKRSANGLREAFFSFFSSSTLATSSTLASAGEASFEGGRRGGGETSE